LAVGLVALVRALHAAAVERFDVVAYGGTPGGIAAAVAAARADARVLLIEPTRHVGGLNTSGLNTSELEAMIGRAVAGFPREFYTRINRAYGKVGPARLWESHVAERAFLDLLAEAHVPVRLGQCLGRVEKDGRRIRSITLDDGSAVAVEVFVDASYEGDLMARAGVSYAVGREGRVVRSLHDLGFRPTAHAGGRSGEMGGGILRDETPAYYADRVGPLSLDD
jgi:flavin-dependent dehydrogenase